MTSSTSAGVPAEGWYPDPTFPGRQRYWSGSEWTQFVWSPGDAQASNSPFAPIVTDDASADQFPVMVDAVAADGTHEGPEIGPETSPGSLGRLAAPLRAPLWLRLFVFALVAFIFGLTMNGVPFVFLLAAAAWCIHGGVRRRAPDGKQRTTSRRVLVGVAVPLGLFAIMIPGIGLGDQLHQSMDPAYAALVVERRAQADEDRKRQDVQDQTNEQAQASKDAEQARVTEGAAPSSSTLTTPSPAPNAAAPSVGSPSATPEASIARQAVPMDRVQLMLCRYFWNVNTYFGPDLRKGSVYYGAGGKGGLLLIKQGWAAQDLQTLGAVDSTTVVVLAFNSLAAQLMQPEFTNDGALYDSSRAVRALDEGLNECSDLFYASSDLDPVVVERATRLAARSCRFWGDMDWLTADDAWNGSRLTGRRATAIRLARQAGALVPYWANLTPNLVTMDQIGVTGYGSDSTKYDRFFDASTDAGYLCDAALSMAR